MNWSALVVAASGVSSLLGLIALLAVVFLWMATRREENSFLKIVEGERVVNPREVVRILETFRDDEARLKALQAILGNDNAKSERIVEKVKSVDVGKLSIKQKRQATTVLAIFGSFLLAFALTGLISQSNRGGQTGRPIPTTVPATQPKNDSSTTHGSDSSSASISLTLMVRIVVTAPHQSNQDSRASDNFTLTPPPGTDQLVWKIEGLPDPRAVGFNLTKDVSLGEDHTVLSGLKDGMVTEPVSGDKLYISALANAPSSFVVTVFARTTKHP